MNKTFTFLALAGALALVALVLGMPRVVSPTPPTPPTPPGPPDPCHRELHHTLPTPAWTTTWWFKRGATSPTHTADLTGQSLVRRSPRGATGI